MGAMAHCQEASEPVHDAAWYQAQDNLKGSVAKKAVDATQLQNAIATKDVVEIPDMEEVLPEHLLNDIINRVEDARALANCMASSKGLREAVSHVKILHLVCEKRYFDLARQRNPIPNRAACFYSDSESERSESSASGEHEEELEEEHEEEHEEEDSGESSEESEGEEEEEEDCCEMSRAMSMSGKYSSSQPIPCRPPPPPQQQQPPEHVSFKTACHNMVQHVRGVEELRIEVDHEMQANMMLKEEIHMVDFWLSEPMFVRKWIGQCYRSLRHLTVVDYGQQAIMRQSPILRILTESCKQLQSLELRNMYLDTQDLGVLPSVQSLTLRCIKMTEYSLTDINNCMPGLITLALVSVFGVQEARFASHNLEVLCLGLSTSAKVVDLDLPKVKKLQLKMTCPETLHVKAPQLAYVAVCMENRDDCVVEFENVHNLKELLFGASHFQTLSELMRTNPLLEKIFLDVPCMALGEDGKWEGVIPQSPLRIPEIEALRESCPLLNTLSLGPGLWHSMEQTEVTRFRRWPALSRLIVHVVVLTVESCLSLLQWLLAVIPSLQVLEIYVHSDSPVQVDHLWSACQERLLPTQNSKLHWGMWRRSLNFQCFSF